MNLKLQSKHVEWTPVLEKLIERCSQKIRKRLPTFPSEVVDLHVHMEKLPRGSQYQTVLVLTLPQRTIRVEEIEDNPSSSVLNAFDELMRRVKKFKSQLNHEKLWRRPPSAVVEAPLAEVSPELEESITENLEKVENYVRRELYHQIVEGNLPPGLLEPQALVDEVFVEVRSRAAERPLNLSLEQWMIQVARQKVKQRLAELSSHQDEPHMEETVHDDSRWDDEALNFYQPDESLRVEDLLEDEKISTPEELLAREEIEQEIHKAIAKLPADIRESFVLFALEGFNSDEVAMITGKKPEEVLEDVRQARRQLRRLVGIA